MMTRPATTISSSSSGASFYSWSFLLLGRGAPG